MSQNVERKFPIYIYSANRRKNLFTDIFHQKWNKNLSNLFYLLIVIHVSYKNKHDVARIKIPEHCIEHRENSKGNTENQKDMDGVFGVYPQNFLFLKKFCLCFLHKKTNPVSYNIAVMFLYVNFIIFTTILMSIPKTEIRLRKHTEDIFVATREDISLRRSRVKYVRY